MPSTTSEPMDSPKTVYIVQPGIYTTGVFVVGVGDVSAKG